MDEPLSNLDAKLRNQMRAEIILLRKRIDTTFVYVTHDQTEAMTLGDRIVIMKDGFIQQVGTPTEVFDMPDNIFVAEFVGAPKMNMIRTDLIKRTGRYFVKPYGVEIEVTGEKAEALEKKQIDSRPVVLGVRPEHMSVADKGIPCRIEINEMMGGEVHLHLSEPSGERMIVRVQTIGLTQEQRSALDRGGFVNVTFTGKAMHFFDPDTERNLLT